MFFCCYSVIVFGKCGNINRYQERIVKQPLYFTVIIFFFFYCTRVLFEWFEQSLEMQRSWFRSPVWHLCPEARHFMKFASLHPSVECVPGSFIFIGSVFKMVPGWNAPQGLENVHTLWADWPEFEDWFIFLLSDMVDVLSVIIMNTEYVSWPDRF